MVTIAPYEKDFYTEANKSKKKIVIYGAGNEAVKVFPFLPKVSYICDKKACEKEVNLLGHRVISIEDLSRIEGKLIVLVTPKDKLVRKEICSSLQSLDIDAEVFELHNNIAFNVFRPICNKIEKRKLNNINIVCYDREGWILRKFADRLAESLNSIGLYSEVKENVNPKADINHHIQFGYEGLGKCRDTIMFSHVNSQNVLEKVRHELKYAEMGICMSRETMNMLCMCGIPRRKLCYINPAHDGDIKPKKYILGITHRCYDEYDFRKRDSFILDVCDQIDKDYFRFRIMGANWERIIESMRMKGFEVDYYPQFDKEVYKELISSLDYYIYQGFDEGSMGILDALSAGVKTIVSPQGFHLDIKGGITYACRTISDYVEVLKSIEEERKRLVNSVAELSWKHYAEKHAEVWNYILGNMEGLYNNQHLYEDGIFSVLRENA